MATDYLTRMYWPKRGYEANGENVTTYGRTFGISARLGANDKKHIQSARASADRHEAFMDMLSRQNGSRRQTAQRGAVSSYVNRSDLEAVRAYSGNRNKTFMSTKTSLDTPLDIALYHGSCNDPFIPNNSYKQYTKKKAQSSARLPLVNKDEYDGILPVHRLYNSAGGYDDSVKASNHIRYYRPRVSDLSEYSVRQGRNGGVWKHVKEVMQSKGQRIMFVDGITSIDNLARVKNNLMEQGLLTNRTSSAPVKRFTTYITPEEMRAAEGVNYRVIR